jgi:GntR family transcriptional regulator
MRIRIDRDLPVAVSTQLQGQIEYGVSNGDFPPGSRLPSVRELALDLGVSPVTVSQVYRTLRGKGIIRTFPGRGTYVVEAVESVDDNSEWHRIDELITNLLVAGERGGISRGALLHRVQQAVSHGRYEAAVNIVFVGVYPEVTRAYVADLRRHLRPQDRIVPTTFADLDGAPSEVDFGDADLVLTFAHRRSDLAGKLPPHCQLATVNLIPSERTRVALAEIDPLAKVVLVSTLPQFLATFRRAVARFASQVESVSAVPWGAPEAENAVATADVVVYGTGSESVLDGLPGHVRSFEYRHTPDPIHVERVLLPLLASIRSAKAATTAHLEEAT